MKKKNIIILLVALLVLSALYLINNYKSWSTVKFYPEMLSVKDTASITSIFMANKNGEKVLLERKENGWYVNNLPADMSKINLLLQTLFQVKVLMPVNDNALNTAVSLLASKGIKTEIYANKKLIKTIYVGTETPDQTGTIMMLDGNDKPVIAHIPGFVGYLTPRFVVNETKMRSRLVFNIQANQIKSVKVNYPLDSKKSFLVQNNRLFDDKNNLVQTADTGFIKFYLNSFTNLYAEGFMTEFSKEETDSLLQSTPFCVISVTDSNDNLTQLTIFKKPVGKRTKERFNAETNEVYEFDTERYYATLNTHNLLMGIQSYSFGRIMRTISDFTRNK
ncbi:MAG: DUF4340 domain-containing protein [Bacteroidia bacterium]